MAQRFGDAALDAHLILECVDPSMGPKLAPALAPLLATPLVVGGPLVMTGHRAFGDMAGFLAHGRAALIAALAWSVRVTFRLIPGMSAMRGKNEREVKRARTRPSICASSEASCSARSPRGSRSFSRRHILEVAGWNAPGFGVNELKQLLIVFAGVLIINAVISGALWAQHRTRLHRACFGVWIGGIFSAVIQGIVQTDPWMIFAFGIGSFATIVMLADLVARALGLRMRWRVYGFVLASGCIATIVGTVAGAPFWLRALPMAIGSALPVFDLSLQALRLPWRSISMSGRVATISAALLALHQLDYPFLRQDPRFAAFGFLFGILVVFAISISAPAIVIEHTAKQVEALNAELQLRVEEALAAVRGRDELLTIAAHEIRGPLNALHLAVTTMRKGRGTEASLPRLYDSVDRADRKLAQFVDQLLDVARIRAGTLELDIEEVDLTEVVREAASQVAELSPSSALFSIAADRPVIGAWDRLRLTQIVNNLLSNAAKFGQDKSIEISASAKDGEATLVVSDQGIGIEPEVMARIFDPFARGVSVRHYSGLGMGLYLVRMLVEAQGGRVTVRSEPGSGSTFTVTLPMRTPPMRAIA